MRFPNQLFAFLTSCVGKSDVEHSLILLIYQVETQDLRWLKHLKRSVSPVHRIYAGITKIPWKMIKLNPVNWCVETMPVQR